MQSNTKFLASKPSTNMLKKATQEPSAGQFGLRWPVLLSQRPGMVLQPTKALTTEVSDKMISMSSAHHFLS